MGKLAFIENREEIAPINGYEVIPAGRYRMKIVECDVVPTKDAVNENKMLFKATCEVQEPGYEGRLLWLSIMIKSDAPAKPGKKSAQQVGQGKLSALSKACGLIGIPDDELKFIERVFIGKVDIEEAQNGYPEKNAINSFYPYDKQQAEATKFSQAKTEKQLATNADDDIPF